MKKTIVVFLLFALLIVIPVLSTEDDTVSTQGNIIDDDFIITFTPNHSSIDFQCSNSFNTRADCEETCSQTCALKEGYCFVCEQEKKQTRLVKFLSKIVSFFRSSHQPSVAQEVKVTTNSDRIANLFIEVTTKNSNADTGFAIVQATQNASIKELIKLERIIREFCKKSSPYSSNYMNTPECQSLISALKKRGDVLKEEMFADIKQDDSDFIKKLSELQALMELSMSASEEETLFSKENIKKISRESKKKFRSWFKARLNADDDSLEEAIQLYLLVKSMERASGEYAHTEDEPGLLGSDVIEKISHAKYNVARQLLRKISEIDVCNPDPEELEKLKKLLRPKTKVGNPRLFCYNMVQEETCDNIFAGDLASAYAWLYERGDFKNNNPEQLPAPPIDCTNKTNTTSVSQESNTSNTTILTLKEDSEDFSNNDNPTPTTTQLEENAPEPVDVLCEVRITENEIIGWEYELLNCEEDFEKSIPLWLECGSPPPMIVAHQEFNECYETGGGFIDTNILIPCQPLPMPPADIIMCVEEFVNEQRQAQAIK